jgi:hypothetical protein
MFSNLLRLPLILSPDCSIRCITNKKLAAGIPRNYETVTEFLQVIRTDRFNLSYADHEIGFLEGFHEKCVLHSLRSRTLNLPLSRAGILLLNYIRIYLQGKSIRSDPIQTFLTSFVK